MTPFVCYHPAEQLARFGGGIYSSDRVETWTTHFECRVCGTWISKEDGEDALTEYIRGITRRVVADFRPALDALRDA